MEDRTQVEDEEVMTLAETDLALWQARLAEYLPFAASHIEALVFARQLFAYYDTIDRPLDDVDVAICQGAVDRLDRTRGALDVAQQRYLPDVFNKGEQ